MRKILKESLCTGCSACANVCTRNAIKMCENEYGFKYPIIDENICNNCGLCKKTCPILSLKTNEIDFDTKVYACWSQNEENRFLSTSGGMFTEFSRKILENDGVVVGAAYDEENLVRHVIVDNEKDLEKLRQSKYLQSDINDIYREVKRKLDSKKLVAFCGAPCQVIGLKKYLRKYYENLFTMEFICRGMNSPKAYKAWLSEIENNEKSKITKVWFKYKVNGWKASPKCTRVDFDNGFHKVFNGEDNLYMCGYLDSNLYIRPSCGNCKFNGIQRQADITLADFWGVKAELDDDKGTSLILINSKKGNDFFELIKRNIIFEERNINEIFKGNVCFTTSVKINKKSKKFLKKINSNNFSKMLNKYSKVSFLKKIVRRIKKIIKKKF